MNYDIINIEFMDRNTINIKNPFFKNYYLEQLIGYGSTGLVYSAINELDLKKYAIKLENLYVDKNNIKDISNYENIKYNTYDDFHKEVNITKIFNDNNIGPKFFDSWINHELEIGIIVTELWHTTLSLYNSYSIPEKIINKLRQEIEKIHNLGYIHYDIKKDNVLIKINDYNEIIDITLTDFSLTEKITDKSTISLEELYKYHSTYASDFYIQLTVSDLENNPMLIDYGLLYQIELCNKNIQIGNYPIKLIGVK